jgi:hypothetical protein
MTAEPTGTFDVAPARLKREAARIAVLRGG